MGTKNVALKSSSGAAVPLPTSEIQSLVPGSSIPFLPWQEVSESVNAETCLLYLYSFRTVHVNWGRLIGFPTRFCTIFRHSLAAVFDGELLESFTSQVEAEPFLVLVCVVFN